MIHTTDTEARRQFMFQFCITLLGGAAQLFEQYWYHEVGEMPETHRQNVALILECYLFGGSIGWYCQSESEVYLSQLVALLVLIMYRQLGHHTRKNMMMKVS